MIILNKWVNKHRTFGLLYCSADSAETEDDKEVKDGNGDDRHCEPEQERVPDERIPLLLHEILLHITTTHTTTTVAAAAIKQ